MTERIEVSIDTLRRAAQILLNHVEEAAGATVAIDTDMFWSITSDQRNNVYTEPTEFTIGQVSESLENLNRLVDDPSSATSFALVWLADTMRVVGEAVVQ